LCGVLLTVYGVTGFDIHPAAYYCYCCCCFPRRSKY